MQTKKKPKTKKETDYFIVSAIDALRAKVEGLKERVDELYETPGHSIAEAETRLKDFEERLISCEENNEVIENQQGTINNLVKSSINHHNRLAALETKPAPETPTVKAMADAAERGISLAPEPPAPVGDAGGYLGKNSPDYRAGFAAGVKFEREFNKTQVIRDVKEQEGK